MFGYVLPPPDVLPPEEEDRFRRMYCGLCHTLGRRYGQAARFLLNYDFTLLAILLTDGTEPPERKGRCAAHPIHGRRYCGPDSGMDLAADESVILAWWKLRDDRQDQRFPIGAVGASAVLRRAYAQAAAYRPGFDAAVRRQMAVLDGLERENCPSMDRAADAFAALLREAALSEDAVSSGTDADSRPDTGTRHSVEPPPNPRGTPGRDSVRRRVLGQLLYHMGRWIYLIDAADDLKKDAASGNYNPVALRYGLRDGEWTEAARESFAETLDHSIYLMTTAFALWDFGVWTPVLEAVFYQGLFRTGRAVLDGTFHRGPSLRRAIRYGRGRLYAADKAGERLEGENAGQVQAGTAVGGTRAVPP